MTRPNPDPLRSALEAVEFCGQQGKCPLCAGWMMSAYGETPGKHTKDCLIGIALASPQGREAVIEEIAADFENSVHHVWDHQEVAERIRVLKSSAPDAWRPTKDAP